MRENFEQRFQERMERRKRKWEQHGEAHSKHGHIWTGLFLLLIGSVALMKSFGMALPSWLFTWQTLLIVLGLFVGIRHRFQGGAWFVMILVGTAFLLNDYILEDGQLRKHFWPLFLIAAGIFFIFRPRRKWKHCGPGVKNENTDSMGYGRETYSQDDFIEATSIFGGTKKKILSKDFKGGDIVNVFGGTELNLGMADIKGSVEIEVTNIFGGTTLILPSDWSVRSEAAVTIFGGIEDKRALSTLTNSTDKVLVLRGTVIFGGIDIKSY